MAKAKFYAEIDTHWQGSISVWYGPFENYEAANTAVRQATPSRADLGQMAEDVKNQARCLTITTSTKSRKAGRKDNNTLSPEYYNIPGSVGSHADAVSELSIIYQ